MTKERTKVSVERPLPREEKKRLKFLSLSLSLTLSFEEDEEEKKSANRRGEVFPVAFARSSLLSLDVDIEREQRTLRRDERKKTNKISPERRNLKGKEIYEEKKNRRRTLKRKLFGRGDDYTFLGGHFVAVRF